MIPQIDAGNANAGRHVEEDVRIAVGGSNTDVASPRIRDADWWRNRRRDYLVDRQFVCRVVACVLLVLAVVNLIPPSLFLKEWFSDWTRPPLSRWVYLQVFISAWIALFAPFVIQVNHWTALKGAAVAMAVAALGWGMAAAGLRLGKGAGNWETWLQLPASLASRASLWCLAMMCLSLVVVYIAGREAQRWQRASELLTRLGTRDGAT